MKFRIIASVIIIGVIILVAIIKFSGQSTEQQADPNAPATTEQPAQ